VGIEGDSKTRLVDEIVCREKIKLRKP